jgi:hypothetical protein
VHPGDAKDIALLNSQARVSLNSTHCCPKTQRPEPYGKAQGFFHLWKMPAASVEETRAFICGAIMTRQNFDYQEAAHSRCGRFSKQKVWRWNRALS